jgi:hypothetical protein
LTSIILNVASRVTVICCQLIMIKLYTINIELEQLGVYFFWLAIAYSANTLIFIPLDYYQQAALQDIKESSGSLHSLLVLNIKVVSVFILTISFASGVVYFISPHNAPYVVITGLLSVFMHMCQSLRYTLNNLAYKNYMSWSYVQESVFKVTIFVLMVSLGSVNDIHLLLSWLFALMIVVTYLALVAYSKGLFKFVRFYNLNISKILVFMYPLSIGAFLSLLQKQGYRFVMVPLGFTAEVGIFATVSGIGSAAIGAVGLIYSQQFMPKLYKSKGASIPGYLKGATAAIIAVMFLFFGFGEFIVASLTKAQFVEYWWLILFGVANDGMTILVAGLMIYLTISNDNKKILISAENGLLSAAICFSGLYVLDALSISSIGIPMLVSELLIVLYFTYIYIRNKT